MKLLKNKDNNDKICDTFDHNFNNFPLYVTSDVAFERQMFVLYDGGLISTYIHTSYEIFCLPALQTRYNKYAIELIKI